MNSLRIGHGYDLHRLAPPAAGGRPLVLAGVRLEHDLGPVAHSDGDAACHAVIDAILGAAGLPDIGQLFPDDDPAFESADSGRLLELAAARVRDAGWEPINLDVTVVLERPRIGPLKDRMRANISRRLGIPADRVNIKGKSHEGMDSIGQGLAVEAHAVALLTRIGP